MTQVGEGQEAGQAAPPVMTFGAPTVGEILAERYELTEHINDDSAGRMVWRGVDVVLRRPVAVVLRYPGGDSAVEMLQAAVTASRVIHPNLVGVYDAIDEQVRAYVVREWVNGTSLREMVATGPLDPAHATSIAHAVTGAVAAVHATGMVHGNVHPGTVLVADDGRVVLTDARADGGDTPETDIRAIGGVLYFALTGHWPHAETVSTSGSQPRGRSALPDAIRDADRAIAAPRQVRAGVPTYLDDLTMDLLDAKLAVPASDVLAAELARLDGPSEEQYLAQAGPLRFTAAEEDGGGPLPAGRRKVAAGVLGLVAVAVAGLLIGINVLTAGNGGDDVASGPTAQPGATTPGAADVAPVGQPQTLTLTADQVRVIDPDGRRDELDGIAAVVDGDLNSGWVTDSYDRNPKFGGIKKGMGILINLNEPRQLSSVQVVLSAPGASAELQTGSSDAPPTKAGDNLILETFTRLGEPYERYDGSKLIFSDFNPDQKYQYLLFWITELPQDKPAKFKIGVQEIVVQTN